MCHADTLHRSQVVCRVQSHWSTDRDVDNLPTTSSQKKPLDTGPTRDKIAPLVSSHSEANPRQQSQRCQFKALVACSCIFIIETLWLNEYTYDNSLLNAHKKLNETKITHETDDRKHLCFFFFNHFFCIFSVYQTFRLDQIHSVRWLRSAPPCLKLGLMTTPIREWG